MAVNLLFEAALGLRLKLLLDGLVCGKDLLAIFGQPASVGAIAVKKLHVKGCFCIFDDTPRLAVGHAHALGCGVQRSGVAHPDAQAGDAAAEHRVALRVGIDHGEPHDRF